MCVYVCVYVCVCVFIYIYICSFSNVLYLTFGVFQALLRIKNLPNVKKIEK